MLALPKGDSCVYPELVIDFSLSDIPPVVQEIKPLVKASTVPTEVQPQANFQFY